MEDINGQIVQLARLALQGTDRDVQLFVRRLARRLGKNSPDVARELDALLSSSPTRGSVLRDYAAAMPVDIDSRLQLARPEYPVSLDISPIWTKGVEQRLSQIVRERTCERELAAAGLTPTRSALFVGPPGVGKTLAARWLAMEMDRPILTLNLSAVMSSFLGRTGANVRQVLDYAKELNCILFLDELDAVAKRRDDEGEIGELKRLVTVLIQEIDEWPESGVLIGATNHPELLDPAIWRRFEVLVEFPMPAREQIALLVSRHVGPEIVGEKYFTLIVELLNEHSFSDVTRELRRLQRESIVGGKGIVEALPTMARELIAPLPVGRRKTIAIKLRKEFGFSEREAYDWTGVSRDTQRNALKTSA